MLAAHPTLPLSKKHGIVPVGFWTTVVGQSNMDLTSMLQWADMADRERRWNGFATDPEWLEMKAGTEKDGPLVENVVNQLLAPTAYSPLRRSATCAPAPASAPSASSRSGGRSRP